jgi:NitT/TauT family transport system ATP-binding protein
MVTHDIQEAVFLSDRVLVMTPLPGRVKRDVVIDLPRPRVQDYLYSSRFAALAHTLRDSLE